MNAEIKTLPNWKRGGTAGEWLAEVAGLAYEAPKKFGRIIVIYEEVDENDASVITRMSQYNIPTRTLLIGTLQTAVLEVYEEMKGRR